MPTRSRDMLSRQPTGEGEPEGFARTLPPLPRHPQRAEVPGIWNCPLGTAAVHLHTFSKMWAVGSLAGGARRGAAPPYSTRGTPLALHECPLDMSVHRKGQHFPPRHTALHRGAFAAILHAETFFRASPCAAQVFLRSTLSR